MYVKSLAQLEDKHGDDSFFAAYALAFTKTGSTLRRQAEFSAMCVSSKKPGKLESYAWNGCREKATRTAFASSTTTLCSSFAAPFLDAYEMNAHEIDKHVAELEQQARGAGQ